MSFEVALVKYIEQNDDGSMGQTKTATLFPGAKCK
jgi:hypothetical protein